MSTILSRDTMTQKEFDTLGHRNYYRTTIGSSWNAIKKAKLLNLIPFVNVPVPEEMFIFEVIDSSVTHLQHGDVRYGG